MPYYTKFEDIPTASYEIVYADPPWSYNDKMKGHSFSLDHEYQTQDLTWIKSLPVNTLTFQDAVLFLWVVSPQLPEGIDVMRAWGFKFKTVAFVWSKEHESGKDVTNLGKWTMGNVEMCLLGVKGHPQRVTRNVRQLVRAVRTVHSRKPDDVATRIVALMGRHKTRIELFARGDMADGWDRWGNNPEWTRL